MYGVSTHINFVENMLQKLCAVPFAVNQRTSINFVKCYRSTNHSWILIFDTCGEVHEADKKEWHVHTQEALLSIWR